MTGFCALHWTNLKQEIINQEMGDLLADNEADARQRLANGIFEPLIWAHNSLGGLAFDVCGPLPGCPVCNLMSVDWPKQAALRAKQQYLLLLHEEADVKPN